MNDRQAEVYLTRIGYTESLKPTFETLQKLQVVHLFAVPFENLDIHLGQRIELSIGRFYEKIIDRRRGGFCYELNGLFNELLLTLGYKTKIISARVYSQSKGHYNPEFDHLAIIVQIDDRSYLTDVGFGEFSLSPILVDLDKIHQDDRGEFMFSKGEEDYWIVNKKENGSWVPEYRFALKERQLADFGKRCSFHQTSPDSHFTQKRLCSLPIINGRMTISGNRFTIKENGLSKEMEIKDEMEFHEILRSRFTIKL